MTCTKNITCKIYLIHLTDKSLKDVMNGDSICLLERERIEQVTSQLMVISSLITPAGKLKKSIHKQKYRHKHSYVLKLL